MRTNQTPRWLTVEGTESRMDDRRLMQHQPTASGLFRVDALRHSLPELAVGALVAVLALSTIFSAPWAGGNPVDLLGFGLLGASAIAFRRAPGWSLALIWMALPLRLLDLASTGADLVGPADLLVAITAFGTARYGSRAVLTLSGLSIPAVISVVIVGGALFFGGYGAPLAIPSLNALDVGLRSAAMPLVLLGIPWLVGLALRATSSATESEHAADVARSGEQQAHLERDQVEVERAQAHEIAILRADQTRMTREVHDVVGHSLAVILAQSESAQFLPLADVEAHRRVLSHVATTARQSLHDVRDVLQVTRDGAAGSPSHGGSMDSLVEGIRGSGCEVESVTVGIARPLPPQLDTVAFRVLQEMLTNALRHGSREESIRVERHWEGDLRIEVANACPIVSPTQPRSGDDESEHTAGTGLEGMQRRLQSVGGFLDVRRRESSDGSARPTFTATAWLPLQS
ncbi:MAG: histidine kinase [Ornithinimicrobium sp.]